MQFVYNNSTLNVDKFKTEWLKLHPEASKNAVSNRLKEVAEKEGKKYNIRPEFQSYLTGVAASSSSSSSPSASAAKRPLEETDAAGEPPMKKIKVVSAFAVWVKEVQASFKEREAPKTAEMSKEERQKHLKVVLKDAWAALDSAEQASWEAKAEEINKVTAAAVTTSA